MAPKWLCFPLKAIQDGQGFCFPGDTVLCCSSCSGKFLLCCLLAKCAQCRSRTVLVSYGRVKLLFDRMPGGLGVLLPKGWVPPRPAVLVPALSGRAFILAARCREVLMVLITSDALQGGGEFHFCASEV